jgi:polyhydroxybutyrate depolymerase
MRRPPLVALVAGALIASCSTSSRSSIPTSRVTNTTAAAGTTPTTIPSQWEGCARAPSQPGVTTRTVQSGGRTRTFQLTIPASYDGRSPLPVVFALHALSVTYVAAPLLADFADMAKRYAFIAVAPSGLLNGPTPFWLAAPVADSYDVRFISDLLEWLDDNLCVDEARVYSTGQSNGAQMSSALACRLGDRITAVAPVDGVEFYDACHGPPVAVIAFTEPPIRSCRTPAAASTPNTSPTRTTGRASRRQTCPSTTASTPRCRHGPRTTAAIPDRSNGASPARCVNERGSAARPTRFSTSSTVAVTRGPVTRYRASRSRSPAPRCRSTRQP